MAFGKDDPLPLYVDATKGIYLQDCKTKSGGAKDANFASIVDDNIEDKIQYHGHAQFDNDQGLPSENSDDKGDDGAEDLNPANVSDVDDFIDDATEDSEHDSQTYTYDFGYSDFGQSASRYLEDCKSISGRAEDANFASVMDANIEDKVEYNGNAKFDNDQGLPSKDVESKDDDEAEYVNPAIVIDVDNSVDDEVEEILLGLHALFDDEHDTQTYTYNFAYNDFGHSAKDCKSKSNGNEDTKFASITDANAEDKIEENRQAIIDKDQGLPSEDGESKGNDGAEDADDFVDDEAGDKSHSYFDDEYDTQTYTHDLGYSDFRPSASMYSEDCKRESEGLEHVNCASIMNASVEDQIDQEVGHASEEDEAIDANTVANNVNASVESKVHDNEQGMEAYYEVEDEDHGNLDDEQDAQVDDNKSKIVNVASNYGDDSVQEEDEDKDHGNSYNKQDMQVEDSKSEGYGTKDTNVARDYVDGSVQENKDHRSSNNKQDMQVEDYKIEGDGTKGANDVASDYVDDNVQDEVDDKDYGNYNDNQDIQVENNKSDCDVTNDAKVARDYVDDSIQDEIEDGDNENSENKQDIQMEDNKGEDDVIKDANIASYHMENNASKDKVLDIRHGNFVNKQVEDDNLASNVDVSVNEVLDKGLGNFDNGQDFSPKAFKKTLERDGYDLCCPDCENFITRTMIFQRTEDCTQHKTTCYSFLIALFCCIRR